MAARFTRGDTMATTSRTAQKGKVAEPRTRSNYLKSGSTMPGMPGAIRTPMGSGTGGIKGGKAMPNKPVGNRNIGNSGHAHNAKRLQGKSSGGTMGPRSAWFTRGAGKMEKLAGTAKAFGERKGSKSNMY